MCMFCRHFFEVWLCSSGGDVYSHWNSVGKILKYVVLAGYQLVRFPIHLRSLVIGSIVPSKFLDVFRIRIGYCLSFRLSDSGMGASIVYQKYHLCGCQDEVLAVILSVFFAATWP